MTWSLTQSVVWTEKAASATVFLFPWYQTDHSPFYWDTRAQPEETNETFDALLASTEALAKLTFADSLVGIPGSQLTQPAEIDAFRHLLQCWTQKGAWVHDPRAPPRSLAHFQDPIFSTCDRRWAKKRKQPTSPRPDTLYRWEVPTTCPLLEPAIDHASWCRLLNGRHMLLVGDLVQYQLHDLFLDALRDGPTVCYGELGCKDHTLCSSPKQARLRYIRNDVLSNRTSVDKHGGAPTVATVEWPFLAHRPLDSFKIVVLNRSPVLESDETFAQELLHSLAQIRDIQPEALIFYRSSLIGHPYCDDAQAPLAFPLQEHQRRHLPYGWSAHTRRNQLAQIIVEAAGGVYIDMASSLDQRPDAHLGHSDCLRFCMPGPLDDWAILLYNVFLALAPN
ncbi:hypothetical protein DM01DRAFT_1287497 [Hesseltinella vesiculosa]|uniref:Uncharacterized protein n=1 Tax=Hesseltinella vesiculosa TaxID=101127 RepID=A0A1X2GHB3_9FUNG|nr:hypothetical protein DM01DRAFT_1287497 [Hesseltinella vesiculosa]